MKKPKSFESWALEKQIEWIDKQIETTEEKLKQFKNYKIDIQTNAAAKKAQKQIKKAYRILLTVRKKTMIHQLSFGDILPLAYYSGRWGERIIGSVAHSPCYGTSYNSNYSLPLNFENPIQVSKNKGFLDTVEITYTHGLICTKCEQFCDNNDDYVIEERKKFQNISNRSELAQFLWDARKNAVKIENRLCSSCEWEEKREKERRKAAKAIKLKRIHAVIPEKLPEYDLEPETYNPRQKWLYVMKCNSTGYHKIGVSVDPALRERTLQSEKPTVKLVAKWEDAQEWESYWHEHFKQHRMRGEWFQLSKCQVAYLCSMMKNRAKLEAQRDDAIYA
jgi:hypothetical protein